MMDYFSLRAWNSTKKGLQYKQTGATSARLRSCQKLKPRGPTQPNSEGVAVSASSAHVGPMDPKVSGGTVLSLAVVKNAATPKWVALIHGAKDENLRSNSWWSSFDPSALVQIDFPCANTCGSNLEKHAAAEGLWKQTRNKHHGAAETFRGNRDLLASKDAEGSTEAGTRSNQA